MSAAALVSFNRAKENGELVFGPDYTEKPVNRQFKGWAEDDFGMLS